MARLKASSQAGNLDFDLNVEPPRRRVRKTDTSQRAGSRFDDFDDFSGEQVTDVPAAAGGSRAAKRRSRGLHWPESTWARWTLAGCALLVLGVMVVGALAVRRFFLRDPRFRIASSNSISVSGSSQVTQQDVLAVFGGDIGRNIFYVPLKERQAQLQALPWVHHATVEMLLPDRLSVVITERVPVAFLSDNGNISLVDADGVQLPMPSGVAGKYSFPVLTGMGGGTQDMRASRMALFDAFLHDVDAKGEKVSERISEIDLADPEDVVATFDEGGTSYAVNFGDTDFAARYGVYQRHLSDWRQQYPLLATIDLRNAPQVTLGMRKLSAPTAPTSATGPKPLDTVATASSNPALDTAPAVTPKTTVAKSVKAAAAPVKTAAKITRSAPKPTARPVTALQHGKVSSATTSGAAPLAAFRTQTPQASPAAPQRHGALHMPGTATQGGAQ